MQGEQAPASIMDALEEAGEQNYDAVLILRGGGSELDLACFDDYDLAVAIATCPVPVVTAIGHDKDVHIADMVAHASVKTPTALADLFLEAYAAQDALLDRLGRQVTLSAQRVLSREELRLKSLDAQVHRAIQGRLASLEASCTNMPMWPACGTMLPIASSLPPWLRLARKPPAWP